MSIDKLNLKFVNYQGPVIDDILMEKITGKIDEVVDGVNNCDGVGEASGSIDSEPLASAKLYYGSTEPNGYKFANGQELSRTEYSELFKIMGTTYGEGDGNTTFNLPNMSGRVPVGLNVNKEWFSELGKTGGSEKITLTIDEMPSHNHGFEYSIDGGTTFSNATLGRDGTYSGNYLGTSDSIQSHSNWMAQISKAGGDKPHNNLQPYITVNYIIKVKNLATLPSNAELIGLDGIPSDTSTYHANAINELINKFKGKKLWTNPNPDDSFEEQIITLNESRLNYDVLEIFFDDYAPYGNYSSSKILSNEQDTYYQLPHAITYYASGVRIRSRFFKFIENENDKIYFYSGTEQGEIDNAKCVPLYIIGYNVGLFNEV